MEEKNVVKCSSCKAVLNTQKDFSENVDYWECTNCGHYMSFLGKDKPKVNQDNFLVEEVANKTTDEVVEKTNDTKVTEVETEKEIKPETKEKEITDLKKMADEILNPPKDKTKKENFITKIKNKFNKNSNTNNVAGNSTLKLAVLCMAVPTIICIIMVISAFADMLDTTNISHSADELEGLNYEDAVEILNNNGFDNIKLIEVDDLTSLDDAKNETVFKVIIKDNDDFKKDTNFRCSSEVILVYNSIKKITMPMSAKDIKGENYNGIVSSLNELGFVNIKEDVIKDLSLGWFVKEFEIEKITINGIDDFKEGKKFDYNSEIIISYHTFKK